MKSISLENIIEDLIYVKNIIGKEPTEVDISIYEKYSMAPYYKFGGINKRIMWYKINCKKS